MRGRGTGSESAGVRLEVRVSWRGWCGGGGGGIGFGWLRGCMMGGGVDWCGVVWWRGVFEMRMREEWFRRKSCVWKALGMYGEPKTKENLSWISYELL